MTISSRAALPARSPMPVSVHSTWRAPDHRRQRVCDRQTEIIMAMRAEGDAVDAAHLALQPPDQFEVFTGRGEADRIRHVDRAGTGLDDGAEQLDEEVGFGARRVFGRELDVLAQGTRLAHAGDRTLDDLGLAHAQFHFAMDRARRDEDVDARLRGVLQCCGRGADIGLVAARQPANLRIADTACDRLHGVEVVLGCIRVTGFDHVDAERLQRFSDAQLLRPVQGAAGTLLAIAQGRVENPQALAH
jgi:hypothetical protein